ncbi:type II toxin-antitoxin system RelE/ParE family toxin [Candidatus Roizmanbacteria bacterium]|nr:type II toxin-antitoxin system RelE/ParE family toxin [Candidatus Roizmanbacteria bacterium]
MIVNLTKTSQKQFESLPRQEAKKVARKLLNLENTPYVGKKLEGNLSTLYSLRAWPYRIIYRIDPGLKIVTIITIEHRQSVYKR